MAEAGAASATTTDRRAVVAEALRPLARLALSGLIVLSPFRARVSVLDERITDTIYIEYTSFLLFVSDVFLIAVLAVWGLSLILQPRKVWLGPALIRWPVIGLLLAIWASIPLSVDPSLSVYNALRVTLAAGLFVYCANEIDSLTRLLPALTLMVTVQALVGIGQVLGQESLGLSALGEYDLSPDAPSASIVWTEDEPRLLRGYGLTDHPNLLGGALALGLLLLATCLRALRGPVWPGLLTALFALGVVALLLSFSRSAMVGFAAGAAMIFFLLAYRRDWSSFGAWLGACLASGLILAAFLAPYAPYLWARASAGAALEGSTEARSLNEREALAKVSNEIFIDNPVTGAGMGALPLAMREAFPEFGFDYQPAHTVLLTAAAETGLPGAFFYGVLLVTPWVLLWYRRRQLTPELIGVSGALLALSIVGLFDYYTWSRAPGQAWLWITLGLWCGAYARALKADADA